MKAITFISTTLVALLVMVVPFKVGAQERAVEITGEIHDVDYLPFWEGLESEPEFPFHFRAVVVENTEAQKVNGDVMYIDSIRSITFELFDANDTLLLSDEYIPPVAGHLGPEGGSVTYVMPGEGDVFLDFDNQMWVGAPAEESLESGRIVSLGVLPMMFGASNYEYPMPGELPGEFLGELYADLNGFPLLLEGPTLYPFQYLYFTPFAENESEFLGFYGFATLIQYLDLDADGDGVADNLDVCSTSILNTNVEFASFDTGISNRIDEAGCSIMDHYAACHVEEEPVRGIRSVRSGPSSCEKSVSYDLVADGIISYSEARILRDALYRASTSVADSPLYNGDN